MKELTVGARGPLPARRTFALEGVEAVAAHGAVAAGRAGAVVGVLVAARARPAALARAREAGGRRRQRARAVRARLRRARVVHALAVHAREALRARAQVLVRCGVLAGAAVLAGFMRTAVVEICSRFHILFTLHNITLYLYQTKVRHTLVAKNSSPISITGAVPGGPVTVAVLAARVRLALRAQVASPARTTTIII